MNILKYQEYTAPYAFLWAGASKEARKPVGELARELSSEIIILIRKMKAHDPKKKLQDAKSIIWFSEECCRLLEVLRECFLAEYIQEKRRREGKPFREQVLVSAEDEVPFAIGWIVDALQSEEVSEADQLVSDMGVLCEYLQSALDTARAERREVLHPERAEYDVILVQIAFACAQYDHYAFCEKDPLLQDIKRFLDSDNLRVSLKYETWKSKRLEEAMGLYQEVIKKGKQKAYEGECRLLQKEKEKPPPSPLLWKAVRDLRGCYQDLLGPTAGVIERYKEIKPLPSQFADNPEAYQQALQIFNEGLVDFLRKYPKFVCKEVDVMRQKCQALYPRGSWSKHFGKDKLSVWFGALHWWFPNLFPEPLFLKTGSQCTEREIEGVLKILREGKKQLRMHFR